MLTIGEVCELRAEVTAWKQAGLRVAFVPTMGNLHAGHLSLVSLAKTYADKVVVSIFVNPLQFGPNEDFDQYPRTYDADKASLIALGDADILFMPSVDTVYPSGLGQTQVCVPKALTGLLEGASRPGHFDGVTTVVLKLLQMVQPDFAVFGQKDYQQLLVIKKMVQDLAMPVQIVSGPIARDVDGLALSSRNQYLTADQRSIAPHLYKALLQLQAQVHQGECDVNKLEAQAVSYLILSGFDQVDYVSIVCAKTLQSVALISTTQPLIVLVVARLGKTRLLDNLLL